MRLFYAITVFVLSCVLIFVTKPSMMFDNDHTIKRFGVDTCFSLGVVTTVLAILSFYLFATIDLAHGLQKKVV